MEVVTDNFKVAPNVSEIGASRRKVGRRDHVEGTGGRIDELDHEKVALDDQNVRDGDHTEGNAAHFVGRWIQKAERGVPVAGRIGQKVLHVDHFASNGREKVVEDDQKVGTPGK